MSVITGLEKEKLALENELKPFKNDPYIKKGLEETQETLSETYSEKPDSQDPKS